MPTGRRAGERYRLLAYQKRDIAAALDSGCLVCIISGPRGIGKTGLAAPLLVWALYDRLGAQVLACSTGMRTAGLAYGRAVRIIESSPRLRPHALVYRNAADPWVELPERGSTMRPLPAEERHIVGFSPTLILVDEVGYVTRGTYEAMQTSLGKAPGTLLLGVGTPGLSSVDADGTNLMYQLREASRSPEPPAGLVYIEHAARPTDDPADRRSWRRANPGLGKLVELDAVQLDLETMSPPRFGQMRLGLWTQHEGALVAADLWDALEVDASPLEEGDELALGFDGSVSRDATALWGYQIARGRLVQLGYWQRPEGARSWAVPRREVVELIDAVFARYAVRALYADPWHWRSELQELAKRHGEERVVEWNTAAPSRMGPATDALLAAVHKRELVHDGSAVLRAHTLSVVGKLTPSGTVVVKDARHPVRIDAFVAALLAHEAGRTAPARVVPAIY